MKARLYCVLTLVITLASLPFMLVVGLATGMAPGDQLERLLDWLKAP